MPDALVSEAGSMHPRFHLPFARLLQQTEHILLDLLVDSIPTKITAPRQCCGSLTMKTKLYHRGFSHINNHYGHNTHKTNPFCWAPTKENSLLEDSMFIYSESAAGGFEHWNLSVGTKRRKQ